jgi:antitoxin (DNA-binding transcriptional repressor) of toxin-antitoxin stability system
VRTTDSDVGTPLRGFAHPTLAAACRSAVASVLLTCYLRGMKQRNLREANQEFSRLVREIERTGERVLVLRNGKPAVEIVPSGENRAVRRRTPAQQRAIAGFLRSARRRPGASSGARRFTRDELHER